MPPFQLVAKAASSICHLRHSSLARTPSTVSVCQPQVLSLSCRRSPELMGSLCPTKTDPRLRMSVSLSQPNHSPSNHQQPHSCSMEDSSQMGINPTCSQQQCPMTSDVFDINQQTGCKRKLMCHFDPIVSIAVGW